MITAKGYSKDPTIVPEGIMLTLPVNFFVEREYKDAEHFCQSFERYMQGEDAEWNFRLTNLPTKDVLYVYLVFDKKVQYRLNLVQYQRTVSKTFKDGPDKKKRHFPHANWVIMSGPAVKPKEEWPQKGFQGFRYTTFLF